MSFYKKYILTDFFLNKYCLHICGCLHFPFSEPQILQYTVFFFTFNLIDFDIFLFGFL